MITLNKKEIYFWTDIDKATDDLSKQILELYVRPLYICGIPRGGLIPAVLLSHKTGIPYQQISSSSISPGADLSHVLFVDDICDSGKTLEKIRNTYNKCRILTLLNKTSASSQPDIYWKTTECDWAEFPWEASGALEERDNTNI
tara:strand:+ start:775 stop:1206 length:432 start_codon:yes stop_codon:yes gene_type:complete